MACLRIQKCFQLTISVILLLTISLILPFVLALSVPVYIFRVIVIYLAKYFRPDIGPIYDELSAMMVRDIFSGKPPRSTILTTIITEGNINLREITNLIQSSWINSVEDSGELKYPQFRCYPVQLFGFTFWKYDDNFDVRNHVFCPLAVCETTANVKVTDNDLDILIEELLNAPYNKKRGLWEVHIVQNYSNSKIHSKELSVILLKFHHSLTDGMGIIDCFVNGLCGIPLDSFSIQRPVKKQKSRLERLYKLGVFPLKALTELTVFLSNYFNYSPWKLSDSTKTWHTLQEKTESISIDDLKLIKNKFGVSLTSVLQSAISYAIHKYWETKKDSNGGIEKEPNRNSMLFMTILPISFKTRSARLTNKFTGVVYNLPTGKFESPVHRLKACNKLLEEMKNSVVPFAFILIMKALGWHFTTVCNLLGKNRMVPAGFTNFMTFKKDVDGYVCGNKILDIWSTCGTHEGCAGVGLIIISFQNSFRVALVAENGILSRKEMKNMLESIQQEIKTLYCLASNTDD